MKRTTPLVLLAAALTTRTAAAQSLPAYHGDAQRTGYTLARGPATPVLKWRLDLQGEVISSPVLGGDGTIYLGSVIRDDRHPQHFITAVNPDGTVKWRFATGWRDTQTMSSPAIGADGRIYVGAQDGYFYALNPDGTLAWRFAAASPVQQHPVVANDGTVYVGIDGRLHAFNPDGTVRWTADLGYNLPGGPSLSPDGETIYAFGYTPAGPTATLYAFRRDGTVRWQYSGFYGYYPALSPPTVAADGTVMVLSGQVVALDPNGVQRWRCEPSAAFYSSYASVAVNPEGEVVFAVNWYLAKINPNGSRQWQLDFAGGQFGNELESTLSAPTIDADGNIYLGLGTGKRWTRPWGKVVRSYTPAGQLRWEFSVGEGVYTSSPAIGLDGTLYIGSMDGALYAISGPPLVPNTITSLSFLPTVVAGGSGVEGVVTLRDPAPAGGATVTLRAPKVNIVRVPATVLVPAGALTANFKVTTLDVTEPFPVNVCGFFGGGTSCADLTVMPAPTPMPVTSKPGATIDVR
jgi:outer membrane protein assembly factor BamB